MRQHVITLSENRFSALSQVEGATSHWAQCRDGLINFKIMWNFKGTIVQRTQVVRHGKTQSHLQNSWREPVPLCEPDKGSGQLPWQLLDSYEPYERCKYSLLDSCFQRGLNRGINNRPPSLYNRLEEFQLRKHNLYQWNIHLFWLLMMWTHCDPGIRYDTHYIQRHEILGQFSVLCWGWMFRAGIGKLERIQGRFNAL